MGGHGTANVTGNVAPREMAELSRPWRCWEDVVKARELYFKYLPLLEASYSATNPVAIKAMVKLMGLPSGDPRPPLPRIEGEKLNPLDEVIRRFKLREQYGLSYWGALGAGEPLDSEQKYPSGAAGAGVCGTERKTWLKS
jgi:4-hydroxy-tetrahydrodipicolinate synthase